MAEDNVYKDGDIVWVKLGNNWWPGEVVGREDRLPEGLNQLKRKPFCVVKFFQEDAYEYPKTAKQVYPFQCPKKDEFIKKGLALFNAKNAFMEKFPDDVKYAESQTKAQTSKSALPFINDRSDSIVKAVLSDGRLRKSTDYYESGQADISGGRNSREQSIRRDSATTVLNISTSNRASIGSVTSMLTPVGASANNVNANFSCQYRCNICDFTTMRQNVLIMHRKSHSSSGSTGIAMPAKTNSSIIMSSSIKAKDCLSAAPTNSIDSRTTPLTSKIDSATISAHHTKAIEESAAELLITPKRNRKKLSVSPNSGSKRATRSTPQSETEAVVVELTDENPDVSGPSKANTAESPKQTEMIRERLLADWSDEEKDETDHLANANSKTATSPLNESSEKLQLPTTSSKSQSRRRTPTIVPMTALEGAGQTLVVGAVTQSTETPTKTPTKTPRIRNIPKKDRQRDFEKSVDVEVKTEIKPTTMETTVVDAVESHTPTSTVLVSLIKSAEKQKTRARSRAEVRDDAEAAAAASTLSCFDFQEDEEDNESDVLKSIAKFKKKYYSPEKEKQKSKPEKEQKTTATQRDIELSAEIDSLLEATSTNTLTTELKTDAVPVKGLPIKERGKRIFKSRNRSRLDEDDDDAAALKQSQVSPDTSYEETSPKVERKLRGRNTPQAIARISPVNGKANESKTEVVSTEIPAKTTTTPTPKRRNRKTHNNRIMQQLIDEEEASIPFIRHSPVELYSCDIAADVGATLVRERGRRSKTSTPNSLTALRDEVVNGNGGGGSGGAGGSRASSRNLNAAPLTPTDETSSFGISEAGAEFGSPASSLDEERLLTPLETPNESEYDGNDSESCKHNELSSEEKSRSTELTEDDDEIESPQHEALSGNEQDGDDNSALQAEKRIKKPKKKTESKKQTARAEAAVTERNEHKSPPLEVAVAEGNLPKRSLRRNRQIEPVENKEESKELEKPCESTQVAAIETVLTNTIKETSISEAENEKEVSKRISHRKTRATRSQTPTKVRKVETPTSASNASATENIEEVKNTNTITEFKHEHENKKENLVLDEALANDAKTENDIADKTTKDQTVDKTLSDSFIKDTGAVHQTVQNQVEPEDSKVPTADKVQKQNEEEKKTKEQKNTSKLSNEHDPTNQVLQSGKAESPLTISNLDDPGDAISQEAEDVKSSRVEKAPKREPVESPTTSQQSKQIESVVTNQNAQHKIYDAQDLKDSPVHQALKSAISDENHKKQSVGDTLKTFMDAGNGKQSPSGSASRKRQAESDEVLPHNHKNKSENTTESLKLDDERKHKDKTKKRRVSDAIKEKDSQEKSRASSPQKHQINVDEKSKAIVSNSSCSSTLPVVEITRINVDVANPLSKHPSIVASMLAATGNASASEGKQAHSNATSKCRSPKHNKIISPLKRKISHDIIGQNADDANNDAVVAHVQSLCPQVKITRKERLIEPIVDAAIPEKLLATPKKSISPQSKGTPPPPQPDISQMPIVISSETVEVASPPGPVSSNLWQTELLQPPPSSEQQQTPPQKRVGFDPRGQKYVMRHSPTEQSLAQGDAMTPSSSGNGRLSPQKSTSASVTGGRKQAGNSPSMPVKQQQHKFAEALALADSILTPNQKPTKRRCSQQTVSNSNTMTSNVASLNRRLSSTAAIDTKTAGPCAKISKQMSSEVRSKSNSPTKMQHSNSSGSGSGSNSPAPKPRSQNQRPIKKQTEVLSDESKQIVKETAQILKSAASSTSTASTPITTLVTAVPPAVDDAQTVVDAEQLNSAAKITAVPIQPIPGYAETFMLCMFVDDVYKPINNIPHYLNKDLNQLVPVPPEAYEGILPEFVVEQSLAAEGDASVATGLNTSSTMTTPSGKSSTIVCSREGGGESLTETSEEHELGVGQHLDESVLVGNVDADAIDAAADNAIVLKLENQHIILDAASFEQLLANPDANTQLLLEDGTEFVLTREVLTALKAQHDDQTAELLAIPADQQQLQDHLIATEAGSSADLLSVALANSEFYGGEMLQIETTLGIGGGDAAGLQLLASDGSIVFQAPPLPQAHLTPPITAHTSETNAVLNQTPIMSTLEKPSTGKAAGIEKSPNAVSIVSDDDLIGARPNLDDSLAVIGVSTQSSTVPSSLELPITITNPAIAPKVTLAGRSVATAAVVASTSAASVAHLYDDSIDNIN